MAPRPSANNAAFSDERIVSKRERSDFQILAHFAQSAPADAAPHNGKGCYIKRNSSAIAALGFENFFDAFSNFLTDFLWRLNYMLKKVV